MEVRLDKVRESPYRWSEQWLPEENGFRHPDVAEISGVSWHGELRFTDPEYLLTASYAYEQTLRCMRCLAPVRQPVQGDFELLVTEEPVVEEFEDGEEIELSERDLGVVTIALDADSVDLDPFLVEQLEVNVPMKPLCRPDCAGLCPECGADLNEGECDCDTEQIDPRWEKLQAVKAQLADDEE